MRCFKPVVPSFMDGRDSIKGYGLQVVYEGLNDFPSSKGYLHRTEIIET
jgi:hypothetical protein